MYSRFSACPKNTEVGWLMLYVEVTERTGKRDEVCIGLCVTERLDGGGRGSWREEEGASLGLLGPKRCHFLPLSCC